MCNAPSGLCSVYTIDDKIMPTISWYRVYIIDRFNAHRMQIRRFRILVSCYAILQINALSIKWTYKFTYKDNLKDELIRCCKKCSLYSCLLLRSDVFTTVSTTERKSGGLEQKPLWLRVWQSTCYTWPVGSTRKTNASLGSIKRFNYSKIPTKPSNSIRGDQTYK